MIKGKELSIEEVKKIIFDILVDFDNFCSTYKLNYSLAGGTLLGAVRHKGFIPWDDDIDVYMPRKDYDFLLTNYNNWGKNKGYKIISSKNSGFYMMIAKIINTKTIAIEKNRTEKIGVWIDILPVDYVGEISGNDIDTLYRCAEEMYFLGTKKYFDSSSQIRKFFKKLLRPFKKRELIKTFNRVLSRNQGNNNICFYSKRRKKVWSILPKNLGLISSDTKLEFEEKSFNVMDRWQDYLKIYFGDDYMKLPPISERISHECAIRAIKQK